MAFTEKYQWVLWPIKLALATLVAFFLVCNLIWQVNLVLAVSVSVMAFIYFKYRWLFWGTAVVGFSLIGLIYFVLFNVNHSIKFTLLRVIFLSLSMILFTYTVSLFMMIFISIPIKVGIKRLFK